VPLGAQKRGRARLEDGVAVFGRNLKFGGRKVALRSPLPATSGNDTMMRHWPSSSAMKPTIRPARRSLGTLAIPPPSSLSLGLTHATTGRPPRRTRPWARPFDPKDVRRRLMPRARPPEPQRQLQGGRDHAPGAAARHRCRAMPRVRRMPAGSALSQRLGNRQPLASLAEDQARQGHSEGRADQRHEYHGREDCGGNDPGVEENGQNN
jgi:hypothetical protein